MRLYPNMPDWRVVHLDNAQRFAAHLANLTKRPADIYRMLNQPGYRLVVSASSDSYYPHWVHVETVKPNASSGSRLTHEDGSPVAPYVVGEYYHGSWHVHEYHDYQKACRAYLHYRGIGRGVRMYKLGILVEQQGAGLELTAC
jgi:hypothetical protein